MAITRKLVAQDQNEENQWLKVDSSSRYIQNDCKEWQFLFGPNSFLTNSVQRLKIAAELDPDTLNSIRFTAYLYNVNSGSIDSGGSCEFKIFKVIKSGWQEQLINVVSGTVQTNNYYYAEKTLSDLTPADLDGSNTLMIEVTITRLSDKFSDRVYVNHLGIYDSFIRLKQQVDYLDLTKLDE